MVCIAHERRTRPMSSQEIGRKLAAILAADVVGYSRLAGADEERILARLRALRSDLIDPTIAPHHGRVVKRTGDGTIVEFRSVVDAVRCAVEVQNGAQRRLPPERRIEFRVASMSRVTAVHDDTLSHRPACAAVKQRRGPNYR